MTGVGGGLTEGRKKGRKHRRQAELQLLLSDFCPVCMLINLPCPGSLEGCLCTETYITTLHQCPRCHFLWQKQKYYLLENMSWVHRGKGDQITWWIYCPADTGSVTWDQGLRQKRRVKTYHPGNSFSFFWIQRLCDYRLLTTNASCWVEGAGLTDSLIVCFLISHSFLCLSFSYVTFKLTHTLFLSHRMQTRLL